MSNKKNGIMRTSVDAMQVGDFIRFLHDVPDDIFVFDMPFAQNMALEGDALEVRRFERVIIEEWSGALIKAWVRTQ